MVRLTRSGAFIEFCWSDHAFPMLSIRSVSIISTSIEAADSRRDLHVSLRFTPQAWPNHTCPSHFAPPILQVSVANLTLLELGFNGSSRCPG